MYIYIYTYLLYIGTRILNANLNRYNGPIFPPFSMQSISALSKYFKLNPASMHLSCPDLRNTYVYTYIHKMLSEWLWGIRLDTVAVVEGDSQYWFHRWVPEEIQRHFFFLLCLSLCVFSLIFKILTIFLQSPQYRRVGIVKTLELTIDNFLSQFPHIHLSIGIIIFHFSDLEFGRGRFITFYWIHIHISRISLDAICPLLWIERYYIWEKVIWWNYNVVSYLYYWVFFLLMSLFLLVWFAVDHSIQSVRGPGDVLTCGACQKQFSLGDIVRFIQHKVRSCPAHLNNHSPNNSVLNNNNNNTTTKNNNKLNHNHHYNSPESPSSSNPCSEEEEAEEEDEDENQDYSIRIPNGPGSGGPSGGKKKLNPRSSPTSSSNTNNNSSSSNHGESGSGGGSIESPNHLNLSSISVVKPSISAPIISRRSKGHLHPHHHHHHHHSREERRTTTPSAEVHKSDAEVNTASSGMHQRIPTLF